MEIIYWTKSISTKDDLFMSQKDSFPARWESTVTPPTSSKSSRNSRIFLPLLLNPPSFSRRFIANQVWENPSTSETNPKIFCSRRPFKVENVTHRLHRPRRRFQPGPSQRPWGPSCAGWSTRFRRWCILTCRCRKSRTPSSELDWTGGDAMNYVDMRPKQLVIVITHFVFIIYKLSIKTAHTYPRKWWL